MTMSNIQLAVADPGGGGAAGARPPFLPNTLKSHLNWLKFTKKSRGQAPKTTGAPLSTNPGSATSWRLLGEILACWQQFQKAVAWMEKGRSIAFHADPRFVLQKKSATTLRRWQHQLVSPDVYDAK